MRSGFIAVLFVLVLAGCTQKTEPLTIEGQVTDALSGLPIDKCVVMVNPGDTVFVGTNSQGEYSIKAHKGYKLVFSKKGYEEKVMSVTTSPMNVQLHEEDFLFFEEELSPE